MFWYIFDTLHTRSIGALMKYEIKILSRPLTRSWNPVGMLLQALTAAPGYSSVVSTGTVPLSRCQWCWWQLGLWHAASLVYFPNWKSTTLKSLLSILLSLRFTRTPQPNDFPAHLYRIRHLDNFGLVHTSMWWTADLFCYLSETTHSMKNLCTYVSMRKILSWNVYVTM